MNEISAFDADNFELDNHSGIFENEGQQLEEPSSPEVISEETLPEVVYLISLDYCRETQYAACQDANLSLKKGDFVVAKTKYGADVVRILGKVNQRPLNAVAKELCFIARLATDQELKTKEENALKVPEANRVFRQKVFEHQLEMKLITSHFLAIEPKVLFFFTADNRIDFRKLVKSLVAVFKLRVELRQIAVRDESRIVGGIGPCGRPFCCSSITDKLPSVSIRMTREQGFSLTSQKSSGQCGRLLCCLSFEHHWYSKERQKYPPIGFRFTVEDKTYVVTDVNIVIGTITITDNQSRTLQAKKEVFTFTQGRWQIDEDFFKSSN